MTVSSGDRLRYGMMRLLDMVEPERSSLSLSWAPTGVWHVTVNDIPLATGREPEVAVEAAAEALVALHTMLDTR